MGKKEERVRKSGFQLRCRDTYQCRDPEDDNGPLDKCERILSTSRLPPSKCPTKAAPGVHDSSLWATNTDRGETSRTSTKRNWRERRGDRERHTQARSEVEKDGPERKARRGARVTWSWSVWNQGRRQLQQKRGLKEEGGEATWKKKNVYYLWACGAAHSIRG